MQRAAQRTESDGPAVSGGLDLLSRAVAADERRDRSGQRRSELLHVGRPVRYVRARTQYADQHGERVGRAACPEGWKVGRDARSLSARLLRQVDGRKD